MVVDDLSDSKIRYLDAVLVNEDVFGFDVPVDDVLLFQETKGYHHLGYESLDH